MSEQEHEHIVGFFDIDEKDTELLLEISKSLGHRVRLIFDPPFRRGKSGPQGVPTQCKIIVEKGDECFAEYILFELQKDRKSRNTAKKALTEAFPKK